MFVRSSCTLDQNLGLVCDYAAAYPETHYNNKKCAVRSALWAASALCAEPKHSTVGGSSNNNKHRKYRNCDRPSQLSQRDSYAVETPGTALLRTLLSWPLPMLLLQCQFIQPVLLRNK